MPTLTDPERALLAPIDARGPAMLARVERWAAINSGSHNLPGLARMADELTAALAPLGEVRRLAAAPADAVGADGAPRPLAHGDNLHLSVRPEARVRVLLTGHIDTVYGPGHPFQACRRVDADTLNGPGVADMKGGLAVMIEAVSAVAASGLAPDLGYEIVINSDEEVSSPGSAPLLAEAAGRCHLGLVYEPALADGTLAGGRRGSGNLSLTVRGRAAHAGRDPASGRNAVVAAADLALRLARLGGDDLSVNVARIDGGGPNNVVPDLAIVRVNLRPVTLAAQARAEAGVAGAVRGVAALHEVAVGVHGGFARPPKPLDANQLRLFETVRAAGADLGQTIAWRDTGGVCDGNNLAAAGLAVVDTLGVLGSDIHSAAETMNIGSLTARARLSALLLVRLGNEGWSR